MVGQTLAHYKILEKIGSGGMGDVYLAEDTKLDRKVALKVLPPELAENEERRARFKREAKAIAALDHPNIVQVFSVEEADGVHFITMQLVHGKTLTELLPKSGFPLNKFFDIAIPLADAVSAAHQEGITHRDLKPDNMMVGEDGRVRVLDFGLAKPTSGFVGGDAESALPTAAKTAEGVIVGTVNYMSPEQAQGQPVDARSDIFSLGIILYEMVRGQRPFRGDAPTSILSSIIKDTPASVTDMNPDLPRDLGKIIRRCLAKDPEHRFQTAKDVRNELEELKQEVASGEAVGGAVPRQMKRALWSKSVWFAGAVVGLLAIAWVVGIAPTADKEPLQPAVPRLTNPVQVTSAVGVEDYPTWSPEAGRVAYHSNQSGNFDIWVAQVGGASPVNLTRDRTGNDRFPSWSPDGAQIAFWSEGKYLMMPALGGNPRLLLEPEIGRIRPQWSPTEAELACVLVEAGQHYLEVISLPSQKSRRLRLPGNDGWRMDPSWSPDGRFLAYVDASDDTAEVTRLWLLRMSDGEAFPVTSGRTNDWSPTWSLDAKMLFFLSNRGGAMDLWAQTLDDDGRADGPPEPVTTGIGMRRAVFSRDGRKLAYSRGRLMANLWRVPILRDRPATWSDAKQLTFDQAFIEFVDVSPDGAQLLVSSDRGGNQDLWMLPVEGGEMKQLTTDPTPDWRPSWSPDGTEIAFYSYRSGNRDIWVMPVEGGPARQLTRHEGQDYHPTWSPDGKEIAFNSVRTGNWDVWIVSSQGEEPRQVTTDSSFDLFPRWSPGGQSLVFTSGRDGIHRLWRLPAEGGEAEPLTKGPASFFRWSPDGKEIYFRSTREDRRNLWVLSLEDGSERPLTDFSGRVGRLGSYSLATDGQYLYFPWEDDLGDIWVMDVVTDESE